MLIFVALVFMAFSLLIAAFWLHLTPSKTEERLKAIVPSEQSQQ